MEPVSQRHRFSASLPELDVGEAYGSGRAFSLGKHCFAEIDAEDRARPPRNQKRVETGAAPQVQYARALHLELREAGKARDAGEGLHRDFGDVCQPLFRVTRPDSDPTPDVNRMFTMGSFGDLAVGSPDLLAKVPGAAGHGSRCAVASGNWGVGIELGEGGDNQLAVLGGVPDTCLD